MDALAEQIDKVAKGDLSRPENILLSQSHTRDCLFNELAQKAHEQTYIPNYETFFRLALKAPSSEQPSAILYDGVNDHLDLCGSLESRPGTSA